MNKAVKRVIVAVVVLAVLVGGAWGAMTFVRASRRTSVNVYSVDYFTTTWWGDQTESNGMVRSDKIQKLFLSDSQTVNEVFVSEGDSVSKGDRLMSYDTTLNDIELEKAQIAIERYELEKTTTKGELDSLNNATSREYLQSRYDSLQSSLDAAWEKLYAEQGKPVELPTGEGTEESPLYVERTAEDIDPIALLDEKTELWIVYVTNMDGSYTQYIGLHFTATEAGWTVALFDAPELPSPEIVETDEIKSLQSQIDRVMDLLATSYSRSEIAQMTAEAEKKLSDLEIQIKISKVEMEQKKKEASDGVVLSDFDGIVKSVRNPEEAYVNGEAVIEVSGGGGYYVTCYVGEFDRDNIQLGQMVTVNSWMNGMTYEGTIVEIQDYPAENADAWSNGNSNISWYPFIVFIDENADLQEYDYVGVTYDASGEENSDSWYLQSFFIRSENGKSYVYVQGENELLEKRYIQTGRDLWGSYTEITGGLAQDELIAFPYGQDVVAGAKTVQAEASDIYG